MLLRNLIYLLLCAVLAACDGGGSRSGHTDVVDTADTTSPAAIASISSSAGSDNIINASERQSGLTFYIALPQGLNAGDQLQFTVKGTAILQLLTLNQRTVDNQVTTVQVETEEIPETGDFLVDVRLIDAAGNESEMVSLNMDIQAAALSVSCQVSPAVARSGTALTATCQGVPAGATVNIPGYTCAAVNVGGLHCTATAGAGNITGNVSGTVNDSAGNSSAVNIAFVLDDVAPAAPAGLNLNTGSDSTINAAERTAGVVLSVDLPGDIVTGDELHIDLANNASVDLTRQLGATEIAAGSVAITLAAADIPTSGVFSLAVMLADAAGNVGASEVTSANVDTAPPAVASCATASSPATPGETVTATCTPAEAGATLSATGYTCAAESGGSITCTATAGDGAGEVSADVAGMLSDIAGNAVAVTLPLSYGASTCTGQASVADATITSASIGFVKLDANGCRVNRATSYAQGARCVWDTRYGDAAHMNRIWMLLASGEEGTADEVNYAEVAALVSGANTAQLCGKTDWAIPSVMQLNSLSTASVANLSYLTIDPAVFADYHGADSDANAPQHTDPYLYSGSSATERYYYWSDDAGNAANTHKMFSYPVLMDYSGSGRSSRIAEADDNNGKDSYTVMYRLLSYTPTPSNFVMLDALGNVTTNAADWRCSRSLVNGLVWMRESVLPQPGEKRRVEHAQTEASAAHVCGVSQWRLPTGAEMADLLPLDEVHFASIQTGSGNEYLTSDTYVQYGSTNPRVYDFASQTLADGGSATDYRVLLTADSVNAQGTTPLTDNTRFAGLDKNGNPTESGAFYCIADTAENLLWTTHLSKDNSASTRSTPGYSTFCGSSNWRLPATAEATSLFADTAVNANIHRDAVAGGAYWTDKEEKQDPACSSLCDMWYYVIDSSGAEQQIDATDYSEQYYHRYVKNN